MRALPSFTALRPRVRVAALSTVLLALLSGSGLGQPRPDAAFTLPESVRPLGLARGPTGDLLVRSRRMLVRPAEGSLQTLSFGNPVDEVVVAGPGLTMAVRADTLGVALIGDVFQPLVRLPYTDMRLSVSEGARLFAYGGPGSAADTSAADDTTRTFVFELVQDLELRPVAALAEPITGVVARGDTLFVASRRLVYRVLGDSLQPFFLDRSVPEIRSLEGTPGGSLLLATDGGLIEIAADGSRGRRLSDRPVDHAIWTPGAIYVLHGDTVSALPLSRRDTKTGTK